MVKDLQKIREMWFSDEPEDKDIAYKWLCQLIGEKDAKANLFVLSFYKDWDDDSGYKDDLGNMWQLLFKTYKISFGKDYRYTVTMFVYFDEISIVKRDWDFSRWEVGNGQPKFELCLLVCQKLKEAGYTFHDELFHTKKKENKRTIP
jgi:hypothetical protein